MTTAQTVLSLARELEAVEGIRADLQGQLRTVDARREDILAQICFAAGPTQHPAPPPAVDPRQVSWVPDAAPQSDAAPQADAPSISATVLDMLRRSPSGVGVGAIASAVNVPAKTVRHALSQLKRRGAATVISRGVWGAQ